MARVKIDLPATFLFATDLPVYINHINYGNHLDNAALLMLVSEARVRFFRHLGYSELDVEGVGVIVADVAVQYRSEAFHGETLCIEMSADDFNKYGCDLVWRASVGEREVARGKHGIMCFDYRERRPALLPPTFLGRLQGHLA